MKKIRLAPPGELLLKEFIQPNGLSVYRVAKDSGIAQPTWQLVVTGKRTITAETALRLGLYFGVEPQFWLNLQAEYDLRIARDAKMRVIEREVLPLAKAA
jgi:addiction module HigA family antidote